MKYVVIGNSAAGIFAMEAIRERDPAGEIIMFTGEKEAPYSRCLTTHFIAGRVSEEGMRVRGGDFYRRNRIEARCGETVSRVDPAVKKVFCRSGEEIHFDRLLIATGATPVVPEIPGIRGEGFFTLRTLQDARSIVRRAARKKPAVVLGGGPVGMKVAYALHLRGIQVTVVVSSPQILSRAMDHRGALLIRSYLEKKGITFYPGARAKEVLRDESGAVRAVRLEDGTELPCGLVIAGKGVRPNTLCLENKGFKINKGVPVDEYQETNFAGIFAAGDVAETYDPVRGERVLNTTWPNAAAQGRLAGRNMAGGGRERYSGSLSLNALEFSGLHAVTAGMAAAEKGLETLEAFNRAEYRYRRLVFRQGRLVGFTAINDIDGVGALTARIRTGLPVADKEALLQGRPPVMGSLGNVSGGW